MTTEEVVESTQDEVVVAQEAQGDVDVASSPAGSESPEGGESVALPTEADDARPVLSESQRVGLLEALLLASGDPLSISRIEEIIGCNKAEVMALADTLRGAYAHESRGLELVNIAQKLQLRTKPLYAEHVRQLIAVKPRKLSQAALETLAVIAYQQPIVKSEIDKIRGVDVSPTIKTLLERKLVKILGYQASVGQPALYGTTEDFLSIFGLTSLSQLPALRDLKALAKEPGEALEAGETSEASDSDEGDEVTDSAVTETTESDQVEAPVQ